MTVCTTRTWTRCLAHDAETGTWCPHRPSHGVFCSTHAWEFQCDEAAKAATRLARARLVLRDPSATPFQQWWAALQARRARSLRRSLFGAITDFENGGEMHVIESDAMRSERPHVPKGDRA